MNVEDRFWSKVSIKGENDCWEWQASINKRTGYGEFRYQHKTVRSNRMAWFLSYGEFPDLFVCHTCDNRRCCNPNHLFLGTNQDNMGDMVAKGRQRSLRGEDHPNFGKHPSHETKQKMSDHHADFTGHKHPRFGTKKTGASSSYFGVSKITRRQGIRYSGRIRVGGKLINITECPSEIEAAKSYDRYVVEHNLPNPLNFPEDIKNGS